MDDNSRVQQWERRVQLPLLLASLLYLTAYSVRVLVPGLSPGWHDFWLSVTVGTWTVFGIDYFGRLALSRPRGEFVRRHWLDLLVLLLPLLRPLRMVHAYAAAQSRRREPRMSLEGQVMSLTLLTALLLGYSAALAVYQAERHAPGATITTFGDAAWWACVTLSTTGYGDVVPVTPLGRVVATVLMAVGVGLIGAVVGVFSSWLVQSYRQQVEETHRPPESRTPPESGGTGPDSGGGRG
ncbi:potassium channel family protein [Streptomyces sp. NPDC001922]|uniref:potassium channel family protein n=1 Tax=Streptomyces sp. NPDC001922 TaxID=3364624 RepID=UPI0036BB030D